MAGGSGVSINSLLKKYYFFKMRNYDFNVVEEHVLNNPEELVLILKEPQGQLYYNSHPSLVEVKSKMLQASSSTENLSKSPSQSQEPPHDRYSPRSTQTTSWSFS